MFNVIMENPIKKEEKKEKNKKKGRSETPRSIGDQ